MFQHELSGLLLLVGRVAVLAEDPFHQDPQLRPHVVPHRPVDGHVLPHGVGELAGDVFERRLAEDLDRAVVRLQRVIERHLVVG